MDNENSPIRGQVIGYRQGDQPGDQGAGLGRALHAISRLSLRIDWWSPRFRESYCLDQNGSERNATTIGSTSEGSIISEMKPIRSEADYEAALSEIKPARSA
jgi:hypothetical protein